MARQITEKNDKAVLDAWKAEAREVKTPEQLAVFVTHLTTDYEHDYGTIVHAIHAAMKAAMRVVDSSPQGGITGFQASCIGWMQVKDLFMVRDGDPLRLVNYSDMLYPQYEDKFAKQISPRTWEMLQKEAKEKLADDASAHPNVKAHWETIAAGRVPFGYTVAAEH